MIDIQLLKSRLTPDDIIAIMDSLDTPLYRADEQNCVFYSSCHHKHPLEHKPKLYLYGDTLHCYSCGFHSDIIGFVQHKRNCNFNQAIAYICNLLHIEATECKQDNSRDNWEILKRWLPNADTERIEPLPQYDKRVLSLFDHLYPQDWLDYGISRDSMNKFGIGWYGRLAAISIPVVFNGELVGIRGRFTRKQDIAKGKYKPLTTLDGTTYKFSTNQLLYAYDQNKDYIAKSRKVILFEGEKSCLKADSKGIHNTLAVFGSNISKTQIQLLLNLGVEEATLAFDSDFHKVGDDEYKYFVAKIKKIVSKLRPYFTTFVAYNNQGYDAYKYSLMDYTDEQAKKIFENRVKIK